jgi:hypothetical protein
MGSIDPKRFFMDTAPLLTKTSDLEKRFNIGKNTRVNRLAMLGLTPDKLEKQGRFFYLNDEQVALFTEFDQHILSTGSCEGFHGLKQGLVEPENTVVIETAEDIDSSMVGGQFSWEEDVEPSGYLVKTAAAEIRSPIAQAELSMPAVEAEYDYSEDTYRANATTQMLVANAQHRATALMLAENALVEQYMNNPGLLRPELRAQIESFEYREIDPKELAASLIAGAQSFVGGAA